MPLKGQVVARDTQAVSCAVAQMIQTSQQLRQMPEFLQQAFQAVSVAEPDQALALKQIFCDPEISSQLQQVFLFPAAQGQSYWVAGSSRDGDDLRCLCCCSGTSCILLFDIFHRCRTMQGRMSMGLQRSSGEGQANLTQERTLEQISEQRRPPT